MAQAGFTPIITYHSTTPSAVPNAANLAPGELALNIADMKLYCENSSGVVTLLAEAGGGGLTGETQSTTPFETSLGSGAGAVNTGVNNTFVGFEAGNDNTTGTNNTAMGYQALDANNTASDNVAVGVNALGANTTGSQQTAIGRDALLNNTTGTQNTAVGYIALRDNSTGINNVGIGRFAGYKGTTGGGNTTINPLTSTDSYAPAFDITTESNRFVAGHTSVTNAYVQVAWTVTSDARDKTNFAPVPHGLNFVNQLEPVAFQFRVSRDSDEAHGNKRYGFKAQDILALEGDDPVIIDTEVPEKLKYQGESLVPVLVNAIKELSAKCDSLQAEINTLKGN